MRIDKPRRQNAVTLPRFNVASKITLGLSVILLIGLVSMLFIYRGLNIVEREAQRLADVEQPTSLAAYEMEINVNGMGLAVLKYLDDADPFYRSWMSDDDGDFSASLREYLRLINTSRERRLGTEVSELFDEFDKLAHRLMEEKDRQAALFEAVAANFEKMDHIIDERLQPAIDRQSPGALAKIEASMDMEAAVAEMAFWTTAYQEVSSQQHRHMIFDKEREFKQALAQLKRLDLLQEKIELITAVEAIEDQTHASVLDIVALEDNLDEETAQFIDLRFRIDNLLDDEIQVLALDDLTAPRQAAYRAADQVLQATRYLIPLYIIAALTVALLLIGLINRPLKKLTEGTEAVAEGNLNYRIDVRGGDEFTDLAVHFNRMVDQLETTLVSKGLLEASEGKLHVTVADLRREIVERERAEHEREALQGELRRSETMAAMGSLVAGVAHEVRNPLFGISSTLDAMNARFGSEELQRYTDVLREEADRLARLMQELLDYGKPALELAPGAIEDAVAEAVQACAPLAQQASIEIVRHIPPDLAPIYMDRLRLSQVFLNLLQNAIQHSPPGSTVCIEIAQGSENERRFITCEVKDSGRGVAKEDLDRMFDPFFTRRTGGTGLGLAIVRRIVEAHGGTIAAGNRRKGGAVMTVRLPLIRNGATKEAAPLRAGSASLKPRPIVSVGYRTGENP